MNTAIHKTKVLFVFYLIGISLLLGLSMGYNIRKEKHSSLEFAKIEALSSYNKDLVYRRWAAMHGGVYVQISENATPNPYLAGIPERDITTTNGKKLTLINPAYMTRQVHELGKTQYGTQGHITSLNPLRPMNKPDKWETKALQAFEDGDTVFSSLEHRNQKIFLRVMKPLQMEKSCMKCHAKQGYEVGDIRGGISVEVPMDSYEQVASKQIANLALTHSGIYLFLLILGIFNYKKLIKDLRNREIIHEKIATHEKNLLNQNKEYKILMQQHIEQNQELNIAKEKAEESDKLKTAFIQNLSHEIRTPMNAIIGFSDMLITPGLPEEKKDEYSNIVKNSSKHLLSIINDILTISALQTNQEKISNDVVDLREMIHELMAVFKPEADAKNIELSAVVKLHEDNSVVYSDRTKLTQIITNLVSNAIKFTEKGTIKLTCQQEDDFVIFSVKDSGIGIKPEFQKLIFERFKQADMSINRKFGGTGLGLSISKGFVELMGGRIWVKSSYNKGAEFSFTILLKPAAKSVVKDSASELTNVTKKILIAEDQEINFTLLKEMLKKTPFEILRANNGKEAVEHCEKYPDLTLVLMDIKMPIMNGMEAARIIKSFRPELPIIAQTAYLSDNYIDEEKNSNFDEVLTKPIYRKEFTTIINKYIAKSALIKTD